MPVHAPLDSRPAKGDLWASLRFALEGIAYVVRSEPNARIDLVVAALVVAMGLWLGLPLRDWAMLAVAMALVLMGEMLNTVVELAVDLVTLDPHPLAKRAKDVAAGAVLLAAAAAAVIGLLVLGPPLVARLGLFGA